MVKRQAGKPCSKILLGDGHPRIAVLDVMPEFFGQVHRAHWHHHGVGAQDAEAGDDEIVPVLHVEQHPVAALHAADVLQVPGQVFYFFL